MVIRKGFQVIGLLLFVGITGIAIACSGPKATTMQPKPAKPEIKTVSTDSLTVFEEDELDKIPEIRGGFGQIGLRLNYPESARKSHTQGTVAIKVLVLKSGEGVNHEITQSVQSDLDNEALRTVRQLSFKPGVKDGKTVNAYRTIQIRFSLGSF